MITRLDDFYKLKTTVANFASRAFLDKLNQLAYESTGNRNAITEDRNGTLSTAYSYSDANNRILWDGDFNYTYDKNGNLSKKISQANNQITEYQWDYKNRLIQVLKRASEDTDPTSTITYKYDALDRRIEKNVDGNIVRYVYDRDNIYLEYDEDNFFRAKFVHSNSVDEPVRMERPTSPYTNANYSRQEFYFHRDRLGNITEITDFEGVVVQRYVYDAFGNTTIYDKDGSEITPSSTNYLENPYAFTGRELDPETGLYFYRARYYDPNVGKFISEDPIGIDGGDFNLYRYVRNNPLNFTDPTGEVVFCTRTAFPTTFTCSRRNRRTGKFEILTLEIINSPFILFGTFTDEEFDKLIGNEQEGPQCVL